MHPTNLLFDQLPIAYLDGGTGSMALQAALASLLTVGYFVKTQWGNLKAVLARRSSREVVK